MTSFTEWPCWTCIHRQGPDGSGTYSCGHPLGMPLPRFLRRALPSDMWRAMGTERQLRGETENEAPMCETYERKRQ